MRCGPTAALTSVVLFVVAAAAAQTPRVGPIYSPDGPASGRRPIDVAPIVLKPGPQLFLDEYLIDSTQNLQRRPITLSRDPAIPNPIVTGARREGEGDKNFQPWLTVIRDPQSQRFRLWYNIGVTKGDSVIGYMESEDGVRWQRPHRELSKPDNVVFCSAVLDEGPQFTPPAERFKMAFYSKAKQAEVWASPDGLEWSFFARGPIPTNDIIDLVHDSARGRYLMTFGAPAVPEDGYKGSTPNAKEGYRRLVGQSASADCKTWTTPRRIIMPGERDEGITEFYGVGGLLPRDDLIVGTVKVLRDDLPCDPNGPAQGIGYTTVAWTHDGENWIRENVPLLDRDHAAGSWDHAHTWVDCQLPVGDEVYLYYGGYKGGHKVNRFEERQIGLVKMKRDRYIAREAGADRGTLRTTPLILEATTLTANVEPIGDGEVRVQVLVDGKPVNGFTFEECQPIKTDSVAAPVFWKADLAQLSGKAIQLEFAVTNARLFGFETK